jgi:hypothetical protein
LANDARIFRRRSFVKPAKKELAATGGCSAMFQVSAVPLKASDGD